jgi:hypothetical protein
MIEVSNNMCVIAAIEAQDTGRELSRLEASVIAQNEFGLDYWQMFAHPRSQHEAIRGFIHENYAVAGWQERLILDMLATYTLNTSDL